MRGSLRGLTDAPTALQISMAKRLGIKTGKTSKLDAASKKEVKAAMDRYPNARLNYMSHSLGGFKYPIFTWFFRGYLDRVMGLIYEST